MLLQCTIKLLNSQKKLEQCRVQMLARNMPATTVILANSKQMNRVAHQINMFIIRLVN